MAIQIENHPLKPFLPPNSKLLMLGSFPPKIERWKMHFYYPNLQNDMWRIFGICFFADKDYFLEPDLKSFDLPRIKSFLQEKGIGIADVAESVIRHKDNASDNFLEIIKQRRIISLLDQVKDCVTIVTTGKKATEVLIKEFNIEEPPIGHFSECRVLNRLLRLYRMPSSSRAYPKALPDKAEIYRQMFIELQMID